MVKCFHCATGLHEWEEGDDPWVEHAKKKPTCLFLKLNKRQSFIDQCHNQELEQQEGASGESHLSDAQISSLVDQWMTTPVVQELVQLNLH